MSYFKEFSSKLIKFSDNEEKILKIWEKYSICQNSVTLDVEESKASIYSFYDGPPFATGLPHYGHLTASVIKDTISRYWHMKGKYIKRCFGWDTHGLPVEIEIEKSIKFINKIKNLGLTVFNNKCKSMVLKYSEEWINTITRVGRCVDLKNIYKTMDISFMESVWWGFSKLWNKNLIYRDFKVMPYSWKLKTPLSNFEAGLNYQYIDDISIYFILKLVSLRVSLLVWTTTPWTVPSNIAVALNKNLSYCIIFIKKHNKKIILLKQCVSQILDEEYTFINDINVSCLYSKKYHSIFSEFKYIKDICNKKTFSIVNSDHVKAENGTGLVHIAPVFGVDDYLICKKKQIPLISIVNNIGNFDSSINFLSGRNVFSCNVDIIEYMKKRKCILKVASIKHKYPFCWRSNTKLMYKAVPSWMVNVKKISADMEKNNELINWVPSLIGSKRFSNWLQNAEDWSISRNRFWGTPIPIWKCVTCNIYQCIQSIDHIKKLSGETSIIDLHRNKVDDYILLCKKCKNVMKRTSEIFDCWFESGSMPHAQFHYPFENKCLFHLNFPADFIAEGLDQTRGWFYTLLVISTAIFNKPAFKNVIVNGLVLASDGAKMSKSKKNYPNPQKILYKYGADSLRLYILNSPLTKAEPLLFKEKHMIYISNKVLMSLSNIYIFFSRYANIDNWKNTNDNTLITNPMDFWILSKLNTLTNIINIHMIKYHLYKIVTPIIKFIDDVTNWYIRLNRRRFWKNIDIDNATEDKCSAYYTLNLILKTLLKLISPILPFISEYIQSLFKNSTYLRSFNSIHNTKYPDISYRYINKDIEFSMNIIKKIITVGRNLREKNRFKIKYPLMSLNIYANDKILNAVKTYKFLICSELNVKKIILMNKSINLKISIQPNFEKLKIKYPNDMKMAISFLKTINSDSIFKLHKKQSLKFLRNSIDIDDVIFRYETVSSVSLFNDKSMQIELNTQKTILLSQEHFIREFLSLVQKTRKSLGFEVTDRIKLFLFSTRNKYFKLLKLNNEYIKKEVLAKTIVFINCDSQAYFKNKMQLLVINMLGTTIYLSMIKI